MAHVSNYARASNGSVFSSLFAFVSNAYATFARARAAEKTYAMLEAMSDRELSDIGLDRSNIADAAMVRPRTF
ncbi:DUF1127 domain-containing protein [Pacificibacter sp. AS14]|uniref:DUF1127 domain-containing protein n=1 Tax=Pacificibacter sp. AS14 TaxID=3135785 RepID=UPI00317D0626